MAPDGDACNYPPVNYEENNQVARSSLSVRYLLSFVAAAGLAGCAGSPSQVTPSGATQLNMHSSLMNPLVKNHCPAHGGVRVNPCTLDFNASNPGPDTVTVRTPKGKKSTLSESDNCTTSSGDVATIMQGSSDQWTVTAGTIAGSCTAEFDYLSKHGKKLGFADLNITNAL